VSIVKCFLAGDKIQIQKVRQSRGAQLLDAQQMYDSIIPCQSIYNSLCPHSLSIVQAKRLKLQVRNFNTDMTNSSAFKTVF